MASTAAPAAGATAAAAPASVASPPGAAAHGNTVGFRTKTMTNNNNNNAITSASPPNGFSFPDSSNANGLGGTFGVTPDRIKLLAGMLAKLPDLDLSEMTRVKACFSTVLGEGRENIVTGLELRVVLGELGVYAGETELGLILRANRDRVNLVTLTQYLRLYKKEFWVAQAAAGAGANSGVRQESSPLAAAHTFKAFSGSSAKSGLPGQSGDTDTLKAFVALGGEEDGGGEIDAAALRDAIRSFGLTIDIDAMIRTVDVHHSGVLDYVDFCALWSSPAGGDGTNASNSAHNGGADLTMGEALLRETSENVGSRRHSSLGSPSDAHQRLMSVLAGTTPCHTSLSGGGQRHRSQVAGYAHELGSNAAGAVRGSSPGSTRTPQEGGGGATALGPYGTRVTHTASTTSGATNALVAHKSVIAPPPTPLTDEEHMLFISMYLFPELYEALSRRVPHFAGGGGNGTSGGAGAGAAANGQSGAEASAFGGSIYQSRLSRQMTSAGARSRSRSQGRTLGASRRKGKGGGAGGAGGGGEDSGAKGTGIGGDFFSPKNQNVYRPPSPMILSMRNSTAYRNRLKRQEEQRRAAQATTSGSGSGSARNGGGGGGAGANGTNNNNAGGGLAQTMQPQTHGSFAGRADGDVDGAAPAGGQKGATW